MKTEQEKQDEAMADYFDSMTQEKMLAQYHNEQVLNTIKQAKGAAYYNDLTKFMNECEHDNSKIQITEEPNGDYQNESWGLITGSWVDQRAGAAGDDYYGTVTVKLSDKKYLEIPFQC